MGSATPSSLVLVRPPERLRHLVETFWILDTGATPCPAPEWILPSVSADIVINRTSDTLRTWRPGGEAAEHVGPLVIAPRDHPFVIHHDPHDHIVGVHLKPGALFALTGRSTAHFRNGCVGLVDVLKLHRPPVEWYPPFTAAHAIETLAALLRERSFHTEVDAISESLVASDPSARSIGDLIESFRFSYYKLNRSSSDRLGFTPKRFLRVRRFEGAVRALRHSPHSLVEIALGNGYYDQAHFHNDFVVFSGVTPTQYRRTMTYDPYHLPASFQKISNTP